MPTIPAGTVTTPVSNEITADPPGSIRHNQRYLPLTRLLPHCHLVVCHAGWGTMIAALDHGLPVVCVPISADGFMNAESCERAALDDRSQRKSSSPAWSETPCEQFSISPHIVTPLDEHTPRSSRCHTPAEVITAIEALV